ncbi:MAG: hypothetical protein KKF93_02870 [Candidatus Omnitrophica bacterium]|nr:hypothetical protein [Candidatus Omnitrophota bacterium]
MKIYDYFKKIIAWFFEEVKDSDNEEKLQNDHIELNMRQAVLIFIIMIVFSELKKNAKSGICAPQELI